jgi:hypothetical protein
VFNHASTSGGGIYISFAGLTLNNTIVAGNTQGSGSGTPSDIVNNSGTVSGSNNLIGDPNSAAGLTTGNHNILGNGSGGVEPISAIVVGTAPANNGGPTLTFALADTSLAINAGNNTLAVDANNQPLTTDQRGGSFSRVAAGTVDIGAVESATLFSSSFSGTNGSPLGADWNTVRGGFVLKDGAAFVKGGPAMALANKVSASDVAVEAVVTLGGNGSRAGLVARYTPPGPHQVESYYWGAVFNNNGHVVAKILRVQGSLPMVKVAPQAKVTTAATYDLRFELLGTSLKLFVNGQLAIFANEGVLTAAGGVGMRARDRASLGSFQISPWVAKPVSLPFSDDFSQGTDSNTQLSLSWMQQQGDFSIASGVLSGTAPLSLAILNNLSTSFVGLHATVTLNARNNNVGFVADYVPGAHGFSDASYYWGYLAEDSQGHFSANIARVVKGHATLLTGGSKPLPNFNASSGHQLDFFATGHLLDLNVDSQSVLFLSDNPPLPGGTAGLLSTQGQTFTSFQADAPHG